MAGWQMMLRNRWEGLEVREKIALVALGLFLGGLVLYFGVWTQSMGFYAEKRADRDRHLMLVQRLQSTEKQARQLLKTGASVKTGGQQILNQVSRSSEQFSIKPSRLQPEGSDGVDVWFDDVVFNDLIRWLEQQTRQGISVRQLSLDREETPGKVNARIVLHN